MSSIFESDDLHEKIDTILRAVYDKGAEEIIAIKQQMILDTISG